MRDARLAIEALGYRDEVVPDLPLDCAIGADEHGPICFRRDTPAARWKAVRMCWANARTVVPVRSVPMVRGAEKA